MNRLTDRNLLDVVGALNALSPLPLDDAGDFGAERALAPTFAPGTDNRVQELVQAGKKEGGNVQPGEPGASTQKAETPQDMQENRPFVLERARRFELPTFSLGSSGRPVVSPADKGLTTTLRRACTAACTRNSASVERHKLKAIAAMLRELLPEDRGKIAAMLLSQDDDTGHGDELPKG